MQITALNTADDRSALETLMQQIGQEHGFNAVSVGFNTVVSIPRYWAANVHWNGFSRTGIACASGHGDTPQAALEAAVKEAIERREPWTDDGAEKAERVERLRKELSELTGEAA